MLNFPTLPSVSRFIPAPIRNHPKMALCVAGALGLIAIIAWKVKEYTGLRFWITLANVKPSDLFTEEKLKDKIDDVGPYSPTLHFLPCCKNIIAVLKSRKHLRSVTFTKDDPIFGALTMGIKDRKPFDTALPEEKEQSWLYQVLKALETKKYISNFNITAEEVTVDFTPRRSA